MNSVRIQRASWAGVTILVAGLGTLSARDKGADVAKSALPADLALVSPNSFAFVSLRPAYVWDHAAFKPARDQIVKAFPQAFHDFETSVGTAPADIERLTIVAPGLMGNVQPMVYVVAGKPYDAKKVFARVLPDAKVEKRKNQSLHVAGRKAVYLINDRAYVLGEIGDMQSMVDRGPTKEAGPLTAALQLAASKHCAVIGGNPEQLRPLTEQLPPEVVPFVPLLEAQSVVVTVDVEKKVQGTLRFSFGGEGKAKEGAKALKALVESARGFLDQGIAQVSKDKEFVTWADVLKEAKTTLRELAVETRGTDVQVTASLKSDLSPVGTFVAQGILKSRTAASRSQSVNNMKQLALAMHNFHDKNRRFPPAANCDENGKLLLSWRVFLLPYLDQNALFKEFHLDEPWDSEHNKKLLPRMPKLFAVPDDKLPPAHTRYQGFVGPRAFFEGKTGTAINGITDGTSNTIMFVEAATSVPWTKPEDLPFDPAKEMPKLGVSPEGFNAAYCDGSVHFLSSSIKAEMLRALITRNGGEVIPANP